MAKEPPNYDLIVLLSTSAPDDRRAKILSDVEAAISGGGGTITRNDDWGRRGMAFRIDHESEAEYHLLQFTAPAELLEPLAYNLRITDGVLRSRIIKLTPGTPPAPDSPPPVIGAAPTHAGGSGGATAAAAAAPAEVAEPGEASGPAEGSGPTADDAPSVEPAPAAVTADADESAPASDES